MDFGEWNFLDNEEAAARPGRGDQSRVFITSLKADTPHLFYFLTKPGEFAGDWVNFRELNTREGLKVGPDLPSDLRFGIMVKDYRMVDNQITGKRVKEIDNNLDPLTAGSPGNQMWVNGSKNTDTNGLVKVTEKCAVNVVDAVTGYHKIVKMSMSARDDIQGYFAGKEKEEEDFDIQGRPYEILYTGEGYKWRVAMHGVRPGSTVIRDGKAVEVPPHPQLGDAIDIRQVLIEQRKELDAILASFPTRSGQPIDTSTAPDFVQEAAAAMAEINDEAFDIFKEAAPKGNGDSMTEKYLAMSPARLRSMLAKAKIDVERGTPKEQMAAMAAEHNL